jgi:hypothetical protein
MGALREMLNSISQLIEEFKLTVASSRKNGIIRNVEETVRDAREIISSGSK